MTNPSDFPDVYRRFIAPIRAKCQRTLGRTDAAEDIAQEAFVRLWQSGPRITKETETRTIMSWLYLTTTRLAIDHLRMKRRHVSEDELVALPGGVSAQEALTARSHIVALIARVERDELEAALLVRVDGLTHPEAATILNVSERTVRRLLERFDEQSASLRKEHSS